MTGTVFITDELEAAPGCIDKLLETYLRDYAPAAKERGMVLHHVWRNPPMAMNDGTGTLTFIWTVDGQAGFWRARHGGNRSPEVAAFWDKIRPMIKTRRRTTHEELPANV